MQTTALRKFCLADRSPHAVCPGQSQCLGGLTQLPRLRLCRAHRLQCKAASSPDVQQQQSAPGTAAFKHISKDVTDLIGNTPMVRHTTSSAAVCAVVRPRSLGLPTQCTETGCLKHTFAGLSKQCYQARVLCTHRLQAGTHATMLQVRSAIFLFLL